MNGWETAGFAVAAGIGHVALCVWAVNVSHALPFHEHRMNKITLGLFGGLGLLTLAFAAYAVLQPLSRWPWPLQVYRLLCLAVAFAGVPLSVVLGILPKTPEGMVRRTAEETLDLSAAEGPERLIGRSRRAWMLRLPGNQSLQLRKVAWDFHLPNLPARLDGLTILHITDTHLSHVYDRRYFEAVVDEAAAWGPFDLVLFTGDLLDDEETLAWVEPVFSRLRGRLGQFGILGNHDVPHRPGRVRKALRSAGFTIVDGRWTTLGPPEIGATIALGGTSAPWGPSLNRDHRPEADFTIVLTHTPDQMPRKTTWGVDLLFAGHNHGGQIRLPWLGPILMPSRYSRRYDQGIFAEGRTIMHVSPGVGGKHPIRYGCPPEIAKIRLRSLQPTARRFAPSVPEAVAAAVP